MTMSTCLTVPMLAAEHSWLCPASMHRHLSHSIADCDAPRRKALLPSVLMTHPSNGILTGAGVFMLQQNDRGWPKVLDIYFENNDTTALSWEEAIIIETVCSAWSGALQQALHTTTHGKKLWDR